jgi:hypothetical protein
MPKIDFKLNNQPYKALHFLEFCGILAYHPSMSAVSLKYCRKLTK